MQHGGRAARGRSHSWRPLGTEPRDSCPKGRSRECILTGQRRALDGTERLVRNYGLGPCSAQPDRPSQPDACALRAARRAGPRDERGPGLAQPRGDPTRRPRPAAAARSPGRTRAAQAPSGGTPATSPAADRSRHRVAGRRRAPPRHGRARDRGPDRLRPARCVRGVDRGRAKAQPSPRLRRQECCSVIVRMAL